MMDLYNLEIRFSDIDALGHVNNAVYLSYFEQARIQFFNQFGGRKWNWAEDGLLLARNEVNYLKPLLLHDQAHIEIRCTHVGTKSFTLAYRLYRKAASGNELCTEGLSVLVCYNYLTKTSIAIPDLWRKELLAVLSA